MSSNLTSIDISNNPDLLRLAEEVAATKTPRKLTRDNKTVAVLMPVAPSTPTKTAYEASLAAIGSWSDLGCGGTDCSCVSRTRRRKSASYQTLTIMRYLLDADWIIQVLAGHNEAVVAHKRINPEEIAVSYITIGEIYDVAFTYANPQAHLQAFRQFLSPFPILDLNEPIMERFADIRSLLRRRGEIISDFDILIGATAWYYGLTVLTYNTRHFKRIPDLKLFPPAA